MKRRNNSGIENEQRWFDRRTKKETERGRRKKFSSRRVRSRFVIGGIRLKPNHEQKGKKRERGEKGRGRTRNQNEKKRVGKTKKKKK